MQAVSAPLAFSVSFICVRLLLSRFSSFTLDHPNERSLHERAVPRTGGIAILAGSATAFAFEVSALWLPIGLAAALSAISFLDDIAGLPPIARLAGHVLAALAFAWFLLTPVHPAVFVLLVLSVAWMTNAYNFMDGSDGLAGGMSVIGFGAYALAAELAGAAALASLAVALAAASFAFLLSNFHPARIFMGDVGSIPLGFLAGALGITGWHEGAWGPAFPILVFSPFIADATLTLLRRLLRRERLWQAHREHCYQRLVLMGFGHRRVALLAYLLMLAAATAGFLVREASAEIQLAALAAGALFYLILAARVDQLWVRSVRAAGP